MCFGDSQTTTTSTPTPNPAVASAATNNLNYVQGLQMKDFQPYGGQQVANLDPNQQASINKIQDIANNGTGAQASSLIGGYANAPAQSVSAPTIASAMSPYMNQYVMQALAPQLQQADIQQAKTAAATNAQATGSGAFGDARTGIEQANNNFNANVAREGLIGNAYNAAFNTAIGAGAQDVSNNLAAQNANAGYNEQALQRMLGGAGALESLQTQQQGAQGAANTAAQQDTANAQANLTAQYNQWLMAQQYPFQTSQLMNQSIAAASGAMPASTTQVTSQPNNSGWALGGSILGGLAGNSGLGSALGSLLFLSDRRLKEDIDTIGQLNDGTPVYSFKYKGKPGKHIGLMAQDVEQRRPDAVHEVYPGGPKMVDYDRASELSRALEDAI